MIVEEAAASFLESSLPAAAINMTPPAIIKTRRIIPAKVSPFLRMRVTRIPKSVYLPAMLVPPPRGRSRPRSTPWAKTDVLSITY